jgi:hypothetical protein
VYVLVFLAANLMMTFGFSWGVFVGFEDMPEGVAVAFGVACVTLLLYGVPEAVRVG